MVYGEIVASVSIDSGSCWQRYTLSEHGCAQVEVFHEGGNVYPHRAKLGPKRRTSHSSLSGKLQKSNQS